MRPAEQGRLLALSEAVIRKGSTSFAVAARLFDSETRASTYHLYAWCRHCDDVIDGQELGFRHDGRRTDPVAALRALRRQTGEALAGNVMADPVFAAFQRVVEKHRIPPRHPFELLTGFEMDVLGRTYRTVDDTLDYCYHVAGVVGVMMAMVMGVRDEQALDRASDLGIAFQLTNIARDVVDDAMVGRVYLPLEWLVEAGLPPGELAAPGRRAELHRVVSRLLDLAERYYDSARTGLAALPPRSRWAVATARRIYREIGREVVRRKDRAWDARVSTGRMRKSLAIIAAGATTLAIPIVGRLQQAPARQDLWSRPSR